MSPEFVYAIYVLIAEIYLMMRQKTKHEITIREVKDYINTTSSQYLLKNLSAYESRTIMLNGDKSAAELWLKNYYINDNSFCEFYKIYRNFTTVRAYILLNQMNKAIDALNQLKTLSNHYDRLLDWAEAEILLTIIHWVSGNKKEAQNLLLEVLNRLQPYGFIRLIANEGSSLVPILSSLLKKIKKEPSRSEHFYNYINKVYIATYEQSKYFKGLTYNKENIMVKLSPQQKYILELLANGHKNAEIVELTGLSLNTIRTHTKITYRKLEVNNVLDAIVKARELGIIK
jgi:LuxR family maltose regulon positive regulatory protein